MLGYPKRDHNFDNHPFSFGLGTMGFLSDIVPVASENGNYYSILGLYRDNVKNGNYYNEMIKGCRCRKNSGFKVPCFGV